MEGLAAALLVPPRRAGEDRGAAPTPEIVAFRGPRVEITSAHLASAAVAIVPIRMGGGKRFKILEAMSIRTPVVPTAIGAEGIDVTHERNIVLADDPAPIGRLLDDPGLAGRLGDAGRALVEERYSWDAVTARLEGFFPQAGASAE